MTKTYKTYGKGARECLPTAAPAVQGNGVKGSSLVAGSKWAKGGSSSHIAWWGSGMLCLGQYPPFADAKRQQLSNLVRHRVLGEPAVGVTLCNSSHVLAEHREQVHA